MTTRGDCPAALPLPHSERDQSTPRVPVHWELQVIPDWGFQVATIGGDDIERGVLIPLVVVVRVGSLAGWC